MLPAALQKLDRQRMIAAIKSAPLGRVDRKIALLRYVERLCCADIAAQTHYSRTVKMPRQHLTHDEAKEWTERMVNADGTTGAHWPYEQAVQLMTQRGLDCNKDDFWAVLNMMYSDYSKVAKSYSVDNPNFYADMTAAFLRDQDAVDGKAAVYWECIADAD